MLKFSILHTMNINGNVKALEFQIHVLFGFSKKNPLQQRIKPNEVRQPGSE